MAIRFRPATRLLPAAAGLLLALAPLAPSQAQGIPFNEIRALNLARNAAVLSNGGLTVYTPANCMFSTSAATNPCLVRSDAGGFVYRFLGGPPRLGGQGPARHKGNRDQNRPRRSHGGGDSLQRAAPLNAA